MVALLLKLTAPSERRWIIDQPANIAARDVAHLILRVALLCASTSCA